MLLLLLVGLEKSSGEFLALLDDFGEIVRSLRGFLGFRVVWHAKGGDDLIESLKMDRNFSNRAN